MAAVVAAETRSLASSHYHHHDHEEPPQAGGGWRHAGKKLTESIETLSAMWGNGVQPERVRDPEEGTRIAEPLLRSASSSRPRRSSTSGNRPATTCRQAVWDFLNCNSIKIDGQSTSALQRLDTKYEIFSIALVCVVVLLDILGSVDDIQDYVAQFGPLQEFAGIVFTVEYTLRIWSCIEAPEFSKAGSFKGRLKWACKPLALADFAVVAAFLAGEISGSSGKGGVQALRMVRLLRLFALFKMDRRSSSFTVIYMVFERKKNELIAALSTALVLMVMSATIMYYIENDAQPDKFSSVPASMWWATAALTTVGYGDLTPVTPFGQIFGGIVAIFGIALFALPAGILGSAYVEVMEDELAAAMNRQTSMDDEGPRSPKKQPTEELLEKMCRELGRLSAMVESLQNGQAELRATQATILEKLMDEEARNAAIFGAPVGECARESTRSEGTI